MDKEQKDKFLGKFITESFPNSHAIQAYQMKIPDTNEVFYLMYYTKNDVVYGIKVDILANVAIGGVSNLVWASEEELNEKIKHLKEDAIDVTGGGSPCEFNLVGEGFFKLLLPEIRKSNQKISQKKDN